MINLILQAAPAGTAGGSLMGVLPFILIMVIFYFFLIRPQNQRLKKHRQMLSEIQRGDTVVTGGGLIGKVTKVADDELTIDLGEGTKVRAIRSMIADVRDRPLPANDTVKVAATNTKTNTKSKSKSKPASKKS